MQVTPEEQGLINADRAYDMSSGKVLDPSQVKFILDSEDTMQRFTAAILRCEIGRTGEMIPIKYKINRTVLENGETKVVTEEYVLRPFMNDLGIKDMKTYLDSYLNKNVYLGEMTEVQIAEMVKGTMFSIADTLYANYREYDINPKDLQQIYNIMFNYIYSAGMRAKNGVTNTLLTKTTQSIQHEVSKMEQPEEKKSFFGWKGR